MQIFKTIKFKLTFWYSLLFIWLSILLILTINIIATNYYRFDPTQPSFITIFQETNPYVVERYNLLNQIERNVINEIRKEDLRKLRVISVFSFFPLMLLSVVGGYIIAERMLAPINKINKATKKIAANNLTVIKHDEVDDEIGELINNFNSMIKRLNISFDLQKEFVENASHELKTPLAIIRTNLELAIANSKTKDLKELKSALNQTKQMNNLIEDLLLLSISANKIEKRKVNLINIVKQSVNELRAFAKESEIKLILNIEAQNALLKGNGFLLQKAISNLIQNSIKYSNKKTNVFITISKRKNKIEFTVKDNGIGISKENQKKIFERFYRIDKSRSKKTGGTGLGLPIAKRIIEEHGGTIVLKSELNKGTTFIVVLPAT